MAGRWQDTNQGESGSECMEGARPGPEVKMSYLFLLWPPWAAESHYELSSPHPGVPWGHQSLGTQ